MAVKDAGRADGIRLQAGLLEQTKEGFAEIEALDGNVVAQPAR